MSINLRLQAQAKERGDNTYIGTTDCKRTHANKKRYTSSGACVACVRETCHIRWLRNYRPKKQLAKQRKEDEQLLQFLQWIGTIPKPPLDEFLTAYNKLTHYQRRLLIKQTERKRRPL